MKESRQVTTLSARIAAHMPALEQRVRKQELAAVVSDATQRGDVSPAGFLELAMEYSAKAKQRSARLAILRKEYAQARTPAERTAVLFHALREEPAPRRAFAALRRGYLDLDAMAERTELAVYELWVRESLALRAAAALTESAVDSQVMKFLLDFLLAPAPALCTIAAAEALTELLTRLLDPRTSDHRWERLCGLLLEPAPRRVTSALARLCLQAAPDAALAALGERLRRTEPADDFLMRQNFVQLLATREQDAAAFALLAAQVQVGEPSEHVRIAWPNALRSTGGTAAVPLLEALAGVAPAVEVELVRADTSPRVRASAAMALAELVRRQQADTSAVLERLLTDPDPLVVQIVIEEIEDLAMHQKLMPEAAASLAAALTRHSVQVQVKTGAKAIEPTVRALEALATLATPELAAARAELAPKLAKLPPGEAIEVTTQVAPLELGRLMSQLARTGFGFYAQPIPGGYRIEHGARFVRRGWRLLHELRMRSPYKRQDAVHTVGRQLPGSLRAPAGLLAEATNTAVPGEPLATRDGTWGQQLPTVDDLLSMPVHSDEPVVIFTPRGVTQIVPPRTLAARMRARLVLSLRYAELAELRQRALDPADAAESARYGDALSSLGFAISQKPYSASGSQIVSPPRPSQNTELGPYTGAGPGIGQVAPGALALLFNPGDFGGFINYLMSPTENTFGQLGAAVLMVSALMLASNLRQRAKIRKNRAAIPMCIGGWGTRGKSGTERLKAAMLHALDLNVLVKTTGCEAMFIHGVPGRRPTEIFIHRSYDKATIWEQRDLLGLASRLGSNVFLWECMALSSPLVGVLSEEWMSDDLQTLTNAYPDHEDIQGPAGHDVARSIAGFIRPGGTAITTEEQMLPVLMEEARRKKARLIVVARRDHLLLADDLLARFPYSEHPRNISLVRRLAVELGIDPDLATADMADHVVPDLGVLKIYPTVTHRSRRLTFINGMSANDRTGFLSNWQRTSCERPVDQPGRWVVTVVNNRYDRVARSKAFAEIIVRDASAERHILIGTNLAGLRVYINEALTHLLQELQLFRRDDLLEQAPELVRARCQRLRQRLRIGPAETNSVLAELSGWLSGRELGELGPAVDAALAAAVMWADGQMSQAEIDARLQNTELQAQLVALAPDIGTEFSAYARRSIARRALLASLFGAAERALTQPSVQAAVTARQQELCRALFLDLVVTVEDSGASGDQVIDAIAGACPPGIEAMVMGIQNIKGTGLDFVYRFIRYDEVNTLVERLGRAGSAEAQNLAAALVARSDFGMLDSALAANAVEAAAARLSGSEGAEDLRAMAAQLHELAQRCQQALTAGQRQRRNPVVRTLEKALDTLDEVRRRWRAESILDALVHREISHERAAVEARRLVDRAKKGWLRQEVH